MSWGWDFGDGRTSIEKNPLHTYLIPGTYTVSLTVTASDGSDTETKTDYITVSPQSMVHPPTFGEGFGVNGWYGEPVSTATGELYFEAVDLVLGGVTPPLAFVRTYASMLQADGRPVGAMGRNWIHGFEVRASVSASHVVIRYYRGKTITFARQGSSWVLTGSEPVPYQLLQSKSVSGTTYHLLDPSSDLITTFADDGRIIYVENRNHKPLRFTYQGGALVRVDDSFGRSIDLSYSGERLVGVTDHAGRSVTYGYSGDT